MKFTVHDLSFSMLLEDLNFWKSHAEESDRDLCEIWDALGLKKDPPGVKAIDRIRDMIEKIGVLQDALDEAKAEVAKLKAEVRVLPEPEVLLRQCDRCGNITAIDWDATPEHAVVMRQAGQTVRRFSQAEAMRLWKTAAKCVCAPLRESKPAPVPPSATGGVL